MMDDKFREFDVLRQWIEMVRMSAVNTLDRMVGYYTCDTAKRFREVGFPPTDEDWLSWRIAMYKSMQDWKEHLCKLVDRSTAELPAIAHYINATDHSGRDPIKFSKWLISEAYGTFANSTNGEPCYQQWTNEKNSDDDWLAKMFSTCLPPAPMLSANGSLVREIAALSAAIGIVPNHDYSNCRTLAHGWSARFNTAVDARFSAAKRLMLLAGKNEEVLPSELGVSLSDVGLAMGLSEDEVASFVRSFSKSRKITAEKIGKDSVDGRKSLYRLFDILKNLEVFSPLSSAEKLKITRHLQQVQREPAKDR